MQLPIKAPWLKGLAKVSKVSKRFQHPYAKHRYDSVIADFSLNLKIAWTPWTLGGDRYLTGHSDVRGCLSCPD